MISEIFILVSMMLFSGCARRPTDLFLAQAQAKQVRINHLLLPSAPNIKVIINDGTVIISWLPLETREQVPDVTFIGYHLYRCEAGGFFAKKLCALIPPHDTSYHDKTVKKQVAYYYMIRGAFLFNERVIEAPASKIIYIQV